MAESNLIKREDLSRVREMEFVDQFGYSVKKLLEALGVTRKIKKQPGTVLKSYKAKGKLESGIVGEGETIPLSKYVVEEINYKEITLKKWRKATTLEAIIERGYDQAVEATTAEMLRDVQRDIRKDFFSFLLSGETSTVGKNFQTALARMWGQLQILFEDDEIQAVYFMNPMDVADYLADHNITVENVFGMRYVENFLGIGTTFFNSSVPQGKIAATASGNIVCYYVDAATADITEAFNFTTDETGLIGIHEASDYDNLTSKDTVVAGVELFAERIDGIVVGTIGSTLGTLTVASAAGKASGTTKLTVTPAKSSAGNIYKYKVGEAAETVTMGEDVSGWDSWDGAADITAATGKTLTLVEADSLNKAVASGSATVTAKG
nr:MAG TPA: major capsid protein [Caudoviricetes sp.]